MTPGAEAVRAYLAQQLPASLRLLREMVAINSFTANADGVNRLADLTAGAFAPLGFTAVRVPSSNPLYGDHLVLRREGRTRNGRSAPVVGLVSHLDTVFPPDEERRNDFQWREAGERIYGPGVVDIKGGTVLMHMILDALHALAPEMFDAVTWVVLLDASEETGGEDFGAVVRAQLGAAALACLIFEGGGWRDGRFRVVAARKGMAVFRIGVAGRAAHAGSAHKRGANAVVQLAEVIRRVDAMTDYGRDLTFNVGTVAGGTVINRVPHFAAASVEMRAFAPDVFEQGVAQMLALNDLATVRAAKDHFPCRVRVEVVQRVAPWPRNPGTERLLHVWQETAASLGAAVVPEERGGLSDGNYFWDAVPTLDGLGPAGGNAHCSERSADGGKEPEYVRVPSFVPKATLNAAAILRLVAPHLA